MKKKYYLKMTGMERSREMGPWRRGGERREGECHPQLPPEGPPAGSALPEHLDELPK